MARLRGIITPVMQQQLTSILIVIGTAVFASLAASWWRYRRLIAYLKSWLVPPRLGWMFSLVGVGARP